MGIATTQRKRNQRERLFRAQRGLCYYCQKPMLLAHGENRKPNVLTLDHIVPLSKGGALSFTENTVAACRRCNSQRGTKDARLFMLEKQGLL